MTFPSSRSIVAAIVVASCVVVPASAAAGSLPSTYKSDAAQSGAAGTPQSTDRTDAAQSGYTDSLVTTWPPADFVGGDSPVDHPGASRAPDTVPTTIEVVRPERTIVRDVDEALPLIISSTALLIVLAGAGVALVRAGMVPRLRRS
jgi:hypothetical protein